MTWGVGWIWNGTRASNNPTPNNVYRKNRRRSEVRNLMSPSIIAPFSIPNRDTSTHLTGISLSLAFHDSSREARITYQRFTDHDYTKWSLFIERIFSVLAEKALSPLRQPTMRSRGDVNLTNMKDHWGIISTRTFSTSEFYACMCNRQRNLITDEYVCLGREWLSWWLRNRRAYCHKTDCFRKGVANTYYPLTGIS